MLVRVVRRTSPYRTGTGTHAYRRTSTPYHLGSGGTGEVRGAARDDEPASWCVGPVLMAGGGGTYPADGTPRPRPGTRAAAIALAPGLGRRPGPGLYQRLHPGAWLPLGGARSRWTSTRRPRLSSPRLGALVRSAGGAGAHDGSIGAALSAHAAGAPGGRPKCMIFTRRVGAECEDARLALRSPQQLQIAGGFGAHRQDFGAGEAWLRRGTPRLRRVVIVRVAGEARDPRLLGPGWPENTLCPGAGVGSPGEAREAAWCGWRATCRGPGAWAGSAARWALSRLVEGVSDGDS